MLKFSDAILGKIDELTELEALDTGKPLQVARADIIALARYFEFYGELQTSFTVKQSLISTVIWFP